MSDDGRWRSMEEEKGRREKEVDLDDEVVSGDVEAVDDESSCIVDENFPDGAGLFSCVLEEVVELAAVVSEQKGKDGQKSFVSVFFGGAPESVAAF